MRALKLTDYAVKAARQMPELRGKKPIGRGVFSAVFDGTRPDTVLKLTVDSRSYFMLNDGVLRCDGPHFPEVVQNFGDVGEVLIREETYSLYLYEVKRLKKLQARTLASRQASALIKLAYSASASTPSTTPDEQQCALALDHLVDMADQHPLLSGSVTDAVDTLRAWVHSSDEVCMDLHRANLMMDDDGRLVINDPICHMELLNRLHTPRHLAWF